MGLKKVKISNVKRSHHLKNKKNYKGPLKTKVQILQGKELQSKKGKGKLGSGSKDENKNLFGKPSGARRRFPTNQRKNKNDKAATKQGDQEVIDDPDRFNQINDMIDGNSDDEKGVQLVTATGNFQLVKETNRSKVKKRKKTELPDADVDLEEEYAAQNLTEQGQKKKFKILLPIKNREGDVIDRQAEEEPIVEKLDEEDVYEQDSDEDILDDQSKLPEVSNKAISTTDLMILREQELDRQKYRIGIICSGILEKPEDKMQNFTALFDLMDEYVSNRINLFTVRKIAMVSLLEVFRDILPEYRIGQVNLKMQTVRKTTMERISYENALLQHYKKFLQKLEKITSILSSKRLGEKKRAPVTKEQVTLAEIGVKCLCGLMTEHPYFNYSQNVAQLLVYLLNSHFPKCRATILKCFQDIFKTDKKFEITLYIVRRINHLVKTKSNNVHVELLNCLLSLQIKSINLDADKEIELKQKKLEAHKARLVNMSKKERKRHKRLTQLDKELNETRAEENKQTKQFKLTEITKMIFTIYFRILKNDPNSSLLSATLEGLAEFAHVINLDFFSDLVEVINGLMEHQDLGHREQLHCIQTIFTILSGQGEVLNIDPLRFYGHFYRNLLIVSAGINHTDLQIILKTLQEVVLNRRKNINHQRLMAFVKRVMTLSLQVLHNGTLACLAIVKSVLQLTSSLNVILDTDTTYGSGRYDPELDDPEFCNADCTALYEVVQLARHYHPTVRKMANNIAAGVPASGEGSLNPEIGKLSPLELYSQFDSTEMAFNPPIPTPRDIESKAIKGRHYYIDETMEKYCRATLRQPIVSDVKGMLDFNLAYRKGLKG